MASHGLALVTAVDSGPPEDPDASRRSRVVQLLDAGHQVDAIAQSGYFAGQNALDAAMDNNYNDIVQLLLERGADPDRMSTALLTAALDGCTPLALCACYNKVEQATLLLRHGASLTKVSTVHESYFAVGPFSGTPIEIARRFGNGEGLSDEIIELFIEVRAQRRWDRVARFASLVGRAAAVLRMVFDEVHYRPGGRGEKRCREEFEAIASEQPAED